MQPILVYLLVSMYLSFDQLYTDAACLHFPLFDQLVYSLVSIYLSQLYTDVAYISLLASFHLLVI